MSVLTARKPMGQPWLALTRHRRACLPLIRLAAGLFVILASPVYVLAWAAEQLTRPLDAVLGVFRTALFWARLPDDHPWLRRYAPSAKENS